MIQHNISMSEKFASRSYSPIKFFCITKHRPHLILWDIITPTWPFSWTWFGDLLHVASMKQMETKCLLAGIKSRVFKIQGEMWGCHLKTVLSRKKAWSLSDDQCFMAAPWNETESPLILMSCLLLSISIWHTFVVLNEGNRSYVWIR